MSGRDDRIRELYEAALKRPIGERAAFVTEHAHGDGDVQRRVEALLAGQQDTRLSGHEAADGGVLATGTEIGHYRIDGPLGAGGMGVVYRATDTKLQRPAAIKVLPENLADPEARRRFQREAQLVSSLNHPHIVTVYDTGEYLERQHLITEFVDGGTLRQWAARPRGWRQIVELLVGVADGVAAAHAAGILHRDIKPENILLAKNGYAKLADFGIAKLLESEPLADDPLTGIRPGGHSTLIGTAAYMSPEQAQGLPLDARSDVYSFGLVLYELLSQERLVERDLARRRGNEPERLAPLGDDVPAELRAIVAKALEPEPADRYQTMRDLVVDLRRLARRSGIETFSAPSTAAPLLTPSAAVPTATKRRTTRQIAYLFGGLALFAIALWLGREYGSQLGAPAGNAVAVLPFANESGDPDDLHLSEGLGDDLRARLMELPAWSVTARTSSVSFRNQNTDIPTVASSLQVTVLINGSLRRRGDTLNVLGEALDAEGHLLKSWTWQGAERDFLALQQDIAADVREFLVPESASAADAKATIPTAANESANMLVVMGEHFEREVRDQLVVDEAKLERAIDFYRRATAADPSSVVAHSRLARALVYRGDVDSARDPLEKALDLGGLNEATTSVELSDVHYTSALYLLRTNSPTGIEKSFKTSIELNPNNADALSAYAQWAGTHGHTSTTLALFREALRLDPLQLSRYVDYADRLATREEMDRVRELASEIRTRFPNVRGYRALARLYETTGELDVGIAWGLKAYEIDPNDLDASRQVAELYARIGDFEKATEFEPNPGIGQLWLRGDYEQLIDEASDLMFEYPDDPEVRYFLAFAMNANGDSPNAIRILEGAGMPIDSASEARTISEEQALTTYIDALQAVGGRDTEARALAEKKLAVASEYGWHVSPRSWWVASYEACSQAQLGRTAEALEALERLKSNQGLALSPLLEDGLCFRRLSGEPRYQAVLDHLEARQAQLRERLPATLREHGVDDVRAITAR